MNDFVELETKKAATKKMYTVKSLATAELQRNIVRRYQEEPNFDQIAREMNLSRAYVHKLYTKALREVIVDDVANLRKVELLRIGDLEKAALEVLRATHPLVNSGEIVRDVVLDEDDNPVINLTTGKPITVKLTDSGPILAAVNILLKCSERRSKLLGIDAPTKIASTTPDGSESAPLVQFYLPHNGREPIDGEEEKGASEG